MTFPFYKSINKIVSELGSTDNNGKLNLSLRVRDTALSTYQVFNDIYTLTKVNSANIAMVVYNTTSVIKGDEAINNEVSVTDSHAVTLNVPKAIITSANFNNAVKLRKEAEQKYFGEYSYDNSIRRLINE